MDFFSELLKIVIPAGLVIYGMYITAVSFINAKHNTNIENIGHKNNEVVTIRLQAYERICLLLERIKPNNLLLRINGSMLSVADFQSVLVSEIREEFNHNLSQQVYMSDMAWNRVQDTVEQTIAIINEAAISIDRNANALELSKTILKRQIEENQNIWDSSLNLIKNEVRGEIF